MQPVIEHVFAKRTVNVQKNMVHIAEIDILAVRICTYDIGDLIQDKPVGCRRLLFIISWKTTQ